MFGFFFAEGPVTCFEEASQQVDLKKFAKFHRGMVRPLPAQEWRRISLHELMLEND